MMEYWHRYGYKLVEATTQHVQIVGIVLLLSILISGLTVLLFIRRPKLMNGSIYLFSVIYSIPSLSLFALLIPFTGLGKTTAIFVLVIYCQYILLRSFTTGIREVDPVIVESAVGMGMTNSQVFTKIQLPLASKAIIAGIRVAATSTIGIATIAATINAGGLGTVLFDGLRTLSLVKLAWGTLLTAGLCIVVNMLLFVFERFILRVEL